MDRRSLHRHDHHELFVLQGRGRLRCDGREYRLKGANLVCISAAQTHAWPEAKELSGVMIAFTSDFLERTAHDRPAPWAAWLANGNDGAAVAAVPTANLRRVETIARLVLEEFEAGESGWLEVVRAQLQTLLSFTARWGTSGVTDLSREAQVLRQFRGALESNFRSVTRIGDYARLLRISETRLVAAVQATSGKSPADLWRERVTTEARRCLMYSPLSVAEIAYGLGFRDPSYFARFFRRATGEGPRGFRTKAREKHR